MSRDVKDGRSCPHILHWIKAEMPESNCRVAMATVWMLCKPVAQQVWHLLLFILAAVLIVGCASLPGRAADLAQVHGGNAAATLLGHVLAPVVAEHSGMSGVYPLEHGV